MPGRKKDIDGLEANIRSLRDKIPVNAELKEDLRQDFAAAPQIKRPRASWPYVAAVGALLVVGLFLGLGRPGLEQREPLLAADLKIQGQISFADIASGSQLAPMVGKEKLYIPVADKGTFVVPLQASREARAELISPKEVLFSALSHDGKTAAFVNNGSIYLYDLASRQQTLLVAGNDRDLFYLDPAWSDDDRTLFITRQQIKWLEHGWEEQSRDIYQIDRQGKNLQKICAGGSAAPIPGSPDLLLERDGQIMVHTKAGQEKVVDRGRFPAVSPDGRYIAYVKNTVKNKKLSEQARVSTDLSDVYVCSVQNFKDGRKLTANYPFRHTDEQEWLDGLNPAAGQQGLVYSGVYSFYDPVWGADSMTLYVLKGGYTEKQPLSILRINLGPRSLAAEDTVTRWLQAYVNRDDDYARSLMKHPEDFMGVSNPHPTGFAIIGSGTRDGQPYVDVRLSVAYNADCFFSLSESRYFLVKEPDGYKIERMEGISSGAGLQVYGKEDGIYLRDQADKETRLLKVLGLTPAGTAGKMHRLSALAYSPEEQLLLYTIQESKRFTLYAYDLEKHRQVFAQSIYGEDPAVMDVSFSGSSQYAVIRYWNEPRLGLCLYDVKAQKLKQIPFLENSTNALWAGDELLVTREEAGGSLLWVYDPVSGRRGL